MIFRKTCLFLLLISCFQNLKGCWGTSMLRIFSNKKTKNRKSTPIRYSFLQRNIQTDSCYSIIAAIKWHFFCTPWKLNCVHHLTPTIKDSLQFLFFFLFLLLKALPSRYWAIVFRCFLMYLRFLDCHTASGKKYIWKELMNTVLQNASWYKMYAIHLFGKIKIFEKLCFCVPIWSKLWNLPFCWA